jgi:hypothetical protein
MPAAAILRIGCQISAAAPAHEKPINQEGRQTALFARKGD